ncbi:hypothetical protein E2P64_00405 [Candidatus Bathyarchaeota archaeon]|nr:hypothetical protein E2P64_00405 [Candidatus Bathyarchaeota archaeon]
MKIAVCSGPESKEISEKIAGNLRSKGHKTRVVSGSLKDYLDSIGEADALLIVNDRGEVSPEMVVAIVLADYLGKRVMATRQPENRALEGLLSSVNVEVVD